MVTPAATITKQKRGFPATTVAKLARHIRNTAQRCLGCTPGCLQRLEYSRQELLHLGIDQTRTPTTTSRAQEFAHPFS